MEAQVKLNPVRIRVPKYGNALMLLMEYDSGYNPSIIRKTTVLDDYFDIQLNMTKHSVQNLKKYINNNL